MLGAWDDSHRILNRDIFSRRCTFATQSFSHLVENAAQASVDVYVKSGVAGIGCSDALDLNAVIVVIR